MKIDVSNDRRKILEKIKSILTKAVSEKYSLDVINHIYKCYKTLHEFDDIYLYDVNDVEYYVIEDESSNGVKVILSSDDSYNLFFTKDDGYSIRFGKTFDEDPVWCPIGPEILDIEISVNGCPKINGASCKFCYKSNTDKAPTNMTLAEYKKIISKIPFSLSQVALGITGTQTNPDFIEMLKWTKEEMGVIPNYTLSGADLTDDILDATVRYCGRVAVSVYESDKQLAYNTIKRFYDKTHKKFCNAHVILSDNTKEFVKKVIEDYSKGMIQGLRNLVFLKAKPVGRAAKLDCTLSQETISEIIAMCYAAKIGFGFDSCTAPYIVEYYKNLWLNDMAMHCEPCESSKFSSYINVKGEYCHCSFCEHIPGFKRYNVLDDSVSFEDLWRNEFQKYRDIDSARYCPAQVK